MGINDGDGPSEAIGGQNSGLTAVRLSTVKLPQNPPSGAKTVFEFFLRRFPRIPREVWLERFNSGKVRANGDPIDLETPYRPLLEVHYRREVEHEPPVRRDYRVVWSDRHLAVVDKPPNLPVTPGGRWVRGCLLHLLLEATGNHQITPLHRLDRLTSGVVILSIDPETRAHFTRLFQPRSMVEKLYTAVCELQRDPPSHRFTLAHHIARSPQEYWRQIARPELTANAECEVEVIAVKDGLALVGIRPSTGRKHQIRVQLAHEGLPILGDPLYGTVRSNVPHDLTQRLWLDAHQLTVHAFPGVHGSEPLSATWTSSRSPNAFFRRAAAYRTRRTPRLS